MKKISILIFLLGTQLAFSQATQQGEQQQTPPSSNSKPDEKPDTPIEYPGGMIALRTDISQIFDPSNLGNSSKISKSMTTFDVNPDGSISSISTTGNNPALNKEMDRVLKALKTKWIPATKNGQPIKSSYHIPMTLNNN
ncbi:energy transducer TonB [Chryseobacterium lactis]|uniref:energy transducer TonB n=1 Tax=Chryseobacterium lactis TaxID=1241981 RepID=UPI001623F90F|nr:hypothetical protein [Chryseobacterium lactis]